MKSSSSQVLRGGAAKAGVVVAVGQPTMPFIIRGEAPDRHPQCVHRVVVAPAPGHPLRAGGGVRAPVGGRVGIGPVARARPLPRVPEQVLDPGGPGPGRPEVASLGGVVGAPDDRPLGIRRLVAPRVAAPVEPAGRLLPLGLAGASRNRATSRFVTLLRSSQKSRTYTRCIGPSSGTVESLPIQKRAGL